MTEDDKAHTPPPQTNADKSRRYFLRGFSAIFAGVVLLFSGVLEKVFDFFFGPRPTEEEGAKLLEQKLSQTEQTVALEKLQLERDHNKYIFIAALDDLSSTDGKYFIDYELGPALAFLGSDGLPDLISAKCTHLGCTVGNEANDKGQVLCPCHVSYFDIKTGMPTPGSPAKAPLPHRSWALLDKQKNTIAMRTADGKTTGNVNPSTIKGADVYLLKPTENIVS